MYGFIKSEQLKVSPHSEYYAIEAMNENSNQTPLMIVVDPARKPQIVVPKSKLMNKSISAVIVPDLSIIDQEFCVEILDVLDSSPIELYKIPLVSSHRGTIHSNSETIAVFNN